MVLNESTNTPEDMYADFLGKIGVYERMSQQAAAAGDAFTAVYAAWAADITVVQAVVLERVMLSSSRPDEQFLAVANSATQAIAAYSSNPIATMNAAEAVAAARESLREAFADSVMVMFYKRFINLDYLANVTIPAPVVAEQNLMELTGGASFDSFLTVKLQEAEALMQAAEVAIAENDIVGAVTYAYQSDLVIAERYLMRAAVSVGDRNMVTLHLRWAAICDAVANMPELPRDFTPAAQQVREYVCRTLGPMDGRRLEADFLPLPYAPVSEEYADEEASEYAAS